MGREARDFPGRGWGGMPTPSFSLPLPPRAVHIPSPCLTHKYPPPPTTTSSSAHLSHRPALGIRANHPASQTGLGASSRTFYFILFHFICTAKHSFQMCLLTEVTFLVLLTCIFFFLIYFAAPPCSYSPSPNPQPQPITFILFFLPSLG